jgi:hypothetical protein
VCSCDTDYSGANCNTFTCFGIAPSNNATCSGSGTCLGADICICNKGFSGSNCEKVHFGQIYAVGKESAGGYKYQLGDEGLIDTSILVQTGGLLYRKFVTKVDAGNDFSYALTSDKRIYGWGSNDIGQIGTGDNPTVKLKPIIPSGLSADIVSVSAGAWTTFAVTSVGAVYGWGSMNNYAGHGTVGSGCCTKDMVMCCGCTSNSGCSGNGCNVGNIAGGSDATYAQAQPTPFQVTSFPSSSHDVKVGNMHTTILTTSGTVHGVGMHQYGQLGYGTLDSGGDFTTSSKKTSAYRVMGYVKNRNIIKIAAGDFHSVAIVCCCVSKLCIAIRKLPSEYLIHRKFYQLETTKFTGNKYFNICSRFR